MKTVCFWNETSADAQSKSSGHTYACLSQVDSNRIFDHLTHGSVDEARTMIDRILNRQPSAARDELLNLYVQIFVVIFRVLKTKSIVYDAAQEGDLAILNRIATYEVQQIRDIMNDYINLSSNLTNALGTTIENILSYIDANYTKNETLTEIAAIFGLSTSHLSKLIKNKTKLTYSSYVNSLRMQQAKHLLETTQLPVSSIYEQIGFISRTTFIRLFKKYVGITPSEYRKQHCK